MMKKSTIEYLPNEILIKILGHLSSFDLMQFCQAYEHLDYFLREKDIIWHSNLSRRFEIYDLNICKFIPTKMNPLLIKVLNINGLFWIRLQDLKILLSKLSNLEELHAIDTKLGIYESVDMEHSKLRKLAISVEDSHFERPIHMSATTTKIISKLKYLYLKIYLQKIQHRESISQFIVDDSFNLEELWIEDFFESPYHIKYDRLLMKQENLKKLVIRCSSVLPFYDSITSGLTKVFDCRKWSAASDVIFEKHPGHPVSSNKSIFDQKSSALEVAWDLFENRLRDLPCGPKERKLLVLGENLVNVHFEELDFFNSLNTCYPKFIDAALEILSSPNSIKLKKLCMTTCLWQKRNSEREAEDSIRVVFKRPRRGVQAEPAQLHPFHKIAENVRNLTELVIISHRGCREHDVIPVYELLGIFENLKKLSIQIPLLLDGTFLKEVFTKCKVLESLNIECTSTNEKFMLNLCQNLKLSTALRDFKLAHKEITIDNLLTSLSEINNRKLLRLVLKCDVIRFSQSSSQTEPFSAFLESNPQLVLFYLCAGKSHKKQNSHWSKRFDLQGMDICKIIPAKMDISLIKVLNINYLHWIPVEDLRELIYRLYNLDELQAMDTTIGLCESDIRLYLRLTKLAISVCRTSFEPPETWRTLKEQRLFNIKIFCIKVYLEETFEREMMINYITKTMRLDELWVQDFLSRDHQTNYDDLVIRMVSLDRVILSFVSAILPVYEFSTWGLYTVFATQRCQSASELIFEKLETPPPDDQMVKVNPPVTALDKAWRRFKLLHSFPACGVEEYKSLHLNEDLNMVDFKELDFCHSQNSCSYPFCKSAMEVLLTPNVTKLKKLQIKSCLWLPKKSKRVVEEGEEEPEEEAEEDYDLDDDSDNDSEEYVLEVKKPRFDVTPEPVELHPFYDVATNIKDLSELEIFVCTSRRCHRPRVINAFRFIEIFTRLKRLLLKIHLMTEGKYFKDVFAKCEMLESLSIKLTINDDDFMMDLVRHIKDSKSLKDFKLEYGELDVDELFDGLNQITNKNMQRLVLKCDVLYFSKSISLTEPFCTFLERNPQLVLFYVVAYKASNEEMNVINEAISKYHKVWKTLYSGTEDKFSIQYAHYDIIDNPNRVGSVDFDRF